MDSSQLHKDVARFMMNSPLADRLSVIELQRFIEQTVQTVEESLARQPIQMNGRG